MTHEEAIKHLESYDMEVKTGGDEFAFAFACQERFNRQTGDAVIKRWNSRRADKGVRKNDGKNIKRIW